MIGLDLGEIQGKAEYQAGMGFIVYYNNGDEYVIEHEGVASHPGDAGVAYIAEKIEELIKAN